MMNDDDWLIYAFSYNTYALDLFIFFWFVSWEIVYGIIPNFHE